MNYDKGVYRSLTQILQFGINMIVPILLCTFLGIFLDRFFHTSFLVIIMFFIGAAAGGRNVYIFARQIFDRPPVRDEVKIGTSNFDESKRITSAHTEPSGSGREAFDEAAGKMADRYSESSTEQGS